MKSYMLRALLALSVIGTGLVAVPAANASDVYYVYESGYGNVMHDSYCANSPGFIAAVYSDSFRGGVKAYFCHKIDDLSNWQFGSSLFDTWNDHISSIDVTVTPG